MPAVTYPNLGLKAGFDPGENGWDDEMTANMIAVSVLAQGGFIDKYAAEPGSPTDGDVVVLDETHGTHPNEVAVWFDDPGAWTYFIPNEGWILYNQTQDYYETFDGTVWAVFTAEASYPDFTGNSGYVLAVNGSEDDVEWVPQSGGVTLPPVQTEAADYTVDPADVGNYIRLTNASTKTVTVDPEATTALPANGEWHFRNVGAGDATLVEGSGVTIHPPAGGSLVVPQDGTVTLKRVAADEFDLIGQTS